MVGLWTRLAADEGPARAAQGTHVEVAVVSHDSGPLVGLAARRRAAAARASAAAAAAARTARLVVRLTAVVVVTLGVLDAPA